MQWVTHTKQMQTQNNEYLYSKWLFFGYTCGCKYIFYYFFSQMSTDYNYKTL